MIKGDDWGRLPLELPPCLPSVRYLKSHLLAHLTLWHPYTDLTCIVHTPYNTIYERDYVVATIAIRSVRV